MQISDKTTEQRFTQELLGLVRGQHFRDPLIDEVRAGTMPRSGLKQWALQAMLVVRQFPRFISAIHSNCPDREAQQLLAENLWEEHGCGDSRRDHLALIEQLAQSLGATTEEIAQVRPNEETTEYINCCLTVARDRSFVESMSAIGIGIEYLMPQFFGALAEALRENYGLSPEQVEYLEVHVSEDAEHARRAAEIIDRFATTGEIRQGARQALGEILEVKRRFAEAIYERCKQ